MSPEQSLQFTIPPKFSQKHHDALITYLADSRNLHTAVWRHLFQGIDLLDTAQVSTPTVTQSFRQVYGELIERPFANE